MFITVMLVYILLKVVHKYFLQMNSINGKLRTLVALITGNARFAYKGINTVYTFPLLLHTYIHY